MGIRAALILVGVALLPGPDANACSCRGPDPLVAPGPFEADVPTNARIWLLDRGGRFAPETGLRLLDPRNTVVPFRSERLTAARFGKVVHVLVPNALLPNTSYRLLDEALGENVTTFTTGEEPDAEPPAIPEVVDTVTRSDPFEQSSCGPTFFASFTLSFDGLLAVADRAETASVDLGFPSGDVADVVAHAEPFAVLGRGGCTGDGWAEADVAARTTVRFGAFDIAGNFSGFGESQAVTLPLAGCGCGAAGAGGGWIALLAVLAGARRPAA